MCGIVGVVDNQVPITRDTLVSMISAIGHRGPDRHAGLLSNGVALGSARLAINSIEAGVQPYRSFNDNYVVLLNGEIFNHLKLRRTLGRGLAYRNDSETETIARLYEKHGTKIFEQFNGQFAIAIWERVQKRLTLARDRFGIRPLFWARRQTRFFFGSEIKALARGGVCCTLSRKNCSTLFQTWTMFGSATPFEEVYQVPPASCLQYQESNIEIGQYWHWPLEDRSASDQYSESEAIEHFRSIFSNALKSQTVSERPLAAALSGGLDSSCITSLLARTNASETRTYSIAFENERYNEQPSQKLFLDDVGCNNSRIVVSNDMIERVIGDVVYHAETPLFRFAAAPVYLLAQKMSADGTRVCLSGEGADEFLLGYDLFRELKIRRFWQKDPTSATRGLLLSRQYSYLPQFNDPNFKRMIANFYKPTLGTFKEYDKYYAYRPRWRNCLSFNRYINPEVIDQFQIDTPDTILNDNIHADLDSLSEIERTKCIEVNGLLTNYLLSSQGDRMSSAHGVEYRYPFLDNDVVNFLFHLPNSYKLKGLKDKHLLREAFRGDIPEAIRTRPKFAYRAPDAEAFQTDSGLSDFVFDTLSHQQLSRFGNFNPSMVEKLLHRIGNRNEGNMSFQDNMAFCLVLSTTILEQKFRDMNLQPVGRSARIEILEVEL